MKSFLRWAIRNTPAMNTLMVAILLVGSVGLIQMHRELFPAFDLEIILVTVPYPGASPEEVEEGICQKIEEAVRSIDGIKKQNSLATEGSGTVVLELDSDVPDVQRVLNEVRSEVDRIPSFPVLAEDPEVKQITLRRAAIRVGVIGPDVDTPEAEVKLRQVTEKVRDELLHLPSVSQANIIGGRDYQIDIEISEATLRKYGLTLQDVARIVRRQNIELPGGTMRTESQEVLLRGKNKQLEGTEIAKIPLVTDPSGVVLTVGDLGTVRDEFIDTTAISRINGKPGLVISVDKTASEDLLAIVGEVRGFVEPADPADGYQLPEGYRFEMWADMSVMVKDRLDLLTRNGIQGLILVLLGLAVFLELRVAFWVALGIPVSMLGACFLLFWGGQTMNMLSMFAFLMALGILVDDAIVIGENIFTHRERGKSLVDAAVDGAHEVLPSVVASVTTTIVAFMPLLFVPGVMGKFIAVMPLAVIAMLAFSLLESTLILPCHMVHAEHGRGEGRRGLFRRFYGFWQRLPLPVTLGLLVLSVAAVLAHVAYPQPLPWTVTEGPWWRRPAAALAYAALGPAALVMVLHLVYPLKRVGDLFAWINGITSRLMEWFIKGVYTSILRSFLAHPAIVLSTAVAILAVACGWARTMPFNFFPDLDSNEIEAKIVYPDGTPASVTDQATQRLEQAILEVNKQEKFREVVELRHRAVGDVLVSETMGPQVGSVGSHVGKVAVQLVETSKRNCESTEVVNAWRLAAGDFPGKESLTFGSPEMGPGGAAIEFKLLAPPEKMEALEAAVEECKKELEKYDCVDIADDSSPGKWEFQLKVKDRAKAMGISLADLAETVRASYYGEEVMRLQRGRHEVKLMVRYPREERRSLANFDEIRVRTAPPVVDLIRRTVERSIAGSGNSGGQDTGNSPERPLTELAEVEVRRGYSMISRQEQLRSITITADIDQPEDDNPKGTAAKEAKGNAQKIVEDLKRDFIPKLLANPDYAGVRVVWEGQQEQTKESVTGLMEGLAVALVAMFALLTLKFRSYFQPVLIMVIIPFGAIGAIVGHWVMGLEITIFSLFGLVALTGVVVNDSIVLIDFINRRVRDGVPLKEALLRAGGRRFRAVFLTSITTIGALLPLLLEKSFQAQVLIPMATSLCFGLMFTTVLVLLLTPTFYLAYARIAMPETLETPEASVEETPQAAVGRDEQVEMFAH